MPRATVNGEPHSVDEATTIADLLRDLDLVGKPVAVEVNERIVPRDDHAARTIQENDVIEIVTAVGGG